MRKLFLILALFCSPIAWATVWTASVSGNINSSATFGGAGTPDCTGSSHDQVVVNDGITLTMNVNCILGTYPSSDTGISVAALAAASTSGTGVVVFSPGIAFTRRGPVYQGFATWTAGAGVLLHHDSSGAATPSTTNYPWHVGSTNGGSSGPYAILALNGTSSSPITIDISEGSGNSGSFGDGSSVQMSGTIQGQWVNISHCGTASIDCWHFYSFFYGGLQASLTNSTIDSSGIVEAYIYGTGSTFTFQNNTMTNPLNTSTLAVNTLIQGGLTCSSCYITQNTIHGGLEENNDTGGDWGQDDQFVVNGNVFVGTSTLEPYDGPTVSHATGHFDGNVMVNYLTGSFASGLPGSITRLTCLMAGNPSGAATHLVCGGISPYAATALNGLTYEREYNDGSGYQGTSVALVANSIPFADTIQGAVAIPAPNGYSPALLISAVGSLASGESFAITHATVMPTLTSIGYGTAMGEGTTGQVGLYPNIEDSVFYQPTSAAGAAYDTFWASGYTPVDGTFGAVDYNDQWNNSGSPYTSIYGGASGWYSSTPGVHDQAVNPNFLGCNNGSSTSYLNCTLKNWATVQGITFTTWDDIIANGFDCMNAASGCPLNPTAPLALYYWERQGFAPTASALKGVANTTYTPAGSPLPMTDTGAVPYQSPSQIPPQFSGLMINNSTDYTLNNTVWTTPSTPLPGAGYFDSTWNGWQFRIPTPSDCAVVSTYNPTGDCTITTRYLNEDYAKVVPWSNDDEFYIAPEQGFWLYLYNRTGPYAYTFNQRFQTGDTSYGSTRDYASTFGLISDSANWLWANNSATPHLIYYTGSTIASQNRTQLKVLDVDTGVITVVHDFSSTIATVNGWGDCAYTATAIDMQREGNQSDDDRYWAFGVTDGSSNGWCAVLVYDKTTDTIIGLQTLGPNGMCGVSACLTLHPVSGQPNWVGMSPSGLYEITNWNTPAYEETWTRGEGTEGYTNTLGYLGVITAQYAHGDVGYDANGLEVYVAANDSENPNGRNAFDVCNLSEINSNAGPGGCRRSFSVPCSWGFASCSPPTGSIGNQYYISMRGSHSAALGWGLLSSQAGAGTNALTSEGNGGWGALEENGMLVDWANGFPNINSGIAPATTTTRINRSHAIYPYDAVSGQGDYESQVNAAPDRTFTKVSYMSNMDVVPSGCGASPYPCSYFNMTIELGVNPGVSPPGVAPQLLFGP